MWYSTKRKRENKGEKDPSASGVISPEADWKSSLPLDWTNMKTNCCKDPSTCKHRLRRRLNTLPNGNNKTTASNKIYGQAVFCLHDFDPKWLQGFFLQRGCKKPWGILAVQEEIDDCMACSAGGYRSLSLTVYHDRNSNSSSSSNYNSSSKTKSKCKSKIEGVDWTGGDMMTLYHPEYVNMTGERLLTGEKALTMLNKYFTSLIDQLKTECHVKDDADILDWLPNVAIVTGSMSLTLPVEL